MAGKPWIVAILAGMVVAMIGVVFLQKSPEGFVVSGLMQISDEEQHLLEDQLKREAAAQLAADKEKKIDPHSISLVKSSKQSGAGVDVAIQAQGKNSRSAMDYLNELMVRYARRQGKLEETVKTKQEIVEAERKLEAALKDKQVTTERIEATEKEIEQLHRREQIEAQRLAQGAQAPENAPLPPTIDAPMIASRIPAAQPKNASRKLEAPEAMESEEEIESPAPLKSAHEEREMHVKPPVAEEEVEPSAPQRAPLTEEERVELIEAIRVMKSERMKLINGGRRKSHPAVQEIERQIRENEIRLNGTHDHSMESRKVQFEYAATPPRGSGAQAEFQKMRAKLEKDLAVLRKRLKRAAETEIAQKEKLAKLVDQHVALNAAFKPVILAPAKVITQLDSPFSFGRLIAVLAGSLVAAVVGYFIAKLGEEQRVIGSISEAESILRMPVQTLEKPATRRRAA